ncbi:zinc finger protein Rlf isoform X2 [Dendrobates tinctorius]
MNQDDFSCDFGMRFKKSIMDSQGILIEFGHDNLQLLVDNIKHGGAWQNPVLVKILSRQTVQDEEVSNWISQEGPCFLQMRIKHLMKTNCMEQAMLLSKISSETTETSSNFFFRQSFITCLCTMLPNEDAFKEISKMDAKDVLDTICNLESEGQVNAAFILCTTYLTQQLQNEVMSFSWELTLFWSKLQRRIDSSLNTFLERCRQFGAIAKTCQHLFFLIKVVHTEAGDDGVPISIMLCIRALQITSTETDATKSSVCKTIACLLPEDLEVKRACQLTEFLFEPTSEGLDTLEELFLQPDQKHVEESSVISNSLRCELLLALKSHWSFDPEFWAWKTLKRHCLKLLGKEVSDSEEERYGDTNEPDIINASLASCEILSDHKDEAQENASIEMDNAKVKKATASSERSKRWQQYKFICRICQKEVIEVRILHHARKHFEDGVYSCPVCVKKFRKKEVFVPHVMEHMKMPMRHRPQKKEKKKKKRKVIEFGPVVECKVETDTAGYISFRTIRDKNLQDRDVYPCPGTGCSKVFKQFKYLSIHLKAEHQNNDENAKHYLNLKNLREKCAFCRRHFISNFHLREHTSFHLGPLPFVCVSIDCNERFKTINQLLNHKQIHVDPQYKCELEGCHLVFGDLGLLYHHEAQHFRDAAYTCTFPQCKKFYYCSSDFQDHIATHVACSGDGLINRTGLFKDLQNERPFSTKIDFTSFSLGRPLSSGTGTHPLPEEHVDTTLKCSSNAEICVHHGLRPDGTCKLENNGKVDCKRLDQAMVKYSTDSDSLLNLLTSCEKSCSTDVKEEQDRPKEMSETLHDRTEPVTYIKQENEDIASSDSFQSSAATSEESLFELLTSLQQLNIKASDSSIFSSPQGRQSKASRSNKFSTAQKGNNSKHEKVINQYLSSLAVKPFVCEMLGCRSAFVTKSALLLHYCKKHQYTKEKALKLRFLQKKYSPFECHICRRHFTKRTLLRIHYKEQHQLSKEKTRSGSGKLDDKKRKNCMVTQRRAMCWGNIHLSESNSNLKRTPSPQDDMNSETCGESLSDEMDLGNVIDAPREDDLAEGRGSRRVVAQGKLCYILNKYHKPFHCIHKSCNASFTSQRSLVRHYQLVHQYNRESLCLEKDKGEKSEHGKCRRIFICKYEECRKRFIGGRPLSEHYKEFHEQADGDEQDSDLFDTENHLKTDTDDGSESSESEFYCDVEGCNAVFTDHTNYTEHILSRHRKYNLYDGRRKRKKREEKLDKNYNPPKRCNRLIYKKKKIKGKNRDQVTRTGVVEYKLREEALQLCAQNIEFTQFPCMVHGCSSVVKLESSIIRHYKLTHNMSPNYVNDHLLELVYRVKNLPKGKEQSISDDDHSPRLTLRSDIHRASNGRPDSLRNSNGDLRRSGPVEISNFKESDIRPFRKSEDRLANSNEKENVSCTGFHTECKLENKASPLRQSIGSIALSSKKDTPQEQIQIAIGLKNFKPMGFESSFLKFLQESQDTDDEFEELEWNYPQNCTLKNSMQNQKRSCNAQNDQQISLSLGQSTASELTLQSLRTMLDKALSDCGDLALKQLHQLYQRPVVVLERSNFTAPLIDLFSNKKNDKLCVGIS